MTRDDQPVIVCSVAECKQPASWWLRRLDGREALRCSAHSQATVTTERRAIDPYDWRSLPEDPFT